MNEALIRNWNDTVKVNDKIFMLGDFAFKSAKLLEEIVPQLNGYKILVMGNHDGYSPSRYLSAGFNEVSRYTILTDGFVLMSHEPLFVNDNTPYINLYGHVHNNENAAKVSRNGACVCVELWNYKPILLSELYRKINDLQ